MGCGADGGEWNRAAWIGPSVDCAGSLRVVCVSVSSDYASCSDPSVAAQDRPELAAGCARQGGIRPAEFVDPDCVRASLSRLVLDRSQLAEREHFERRGHFVQSFSPRLPPPVKILVCVLGRRGSWVRPTARVARASSPHVVSAPQLASFVRSSNCRELAPGRLPRAVPVNDGPSHETALTAPLTGRRVSTGLLPLRPERPSQSPS